MAPYRIYPSREALTERFTAECLAAGHDAPPCAEHQRLIEEQVARTEERISSPEVDASTQRFVDEHCNHTSEDCTHGGSNA